MKSTSNPQSFIGVCGVQSADDYDKLRILSAHILPGSSRFLMAGVKNSATTIDTTSLSPDVQPFVHCDFTDAESFERTVTRNLKNSRIYVRGLQLNVLPWMTTDFEPLWKSLRRQYPELKLMLQAHKAIMDSYTPSEIAKRLQTQSVDYIFFDPSQSKGIAYDPRVMDTYIAATYQYNPSAQVAIAGGLGGHNIQQLFKPLVHKYPALSCDAFGQLYDHDTGNLSWPAVERYLRNWRETLAEPRTSVDTFSKALYYSQA